MTNQEPKNTKPCFFFIPPASPANKHIDSKDLTESKSFDNIKSGGFAFCSNVCFIKNKHLRQNSINQ